MVDALEHTIGIYNPGNALHSIADTMLRPGTYYLKVDGKGNQYASEYGSMGSYSLQGTYTAITPLPLKKLVLTGVTERGVHQLSWVVEADEALVKQVLQVSHNGSAYHDIPTAEININTYTYIPVALGVSVYRLQVTFDNGRQYFSNTISLKDQPVRIPHLVENVMRTNRILVNSPADYNYCIVDNSGRKVATGAVNRGTGVIYSNNITNGSYIIMFTNGQQQFVEKFVKQ